jgi:hypothetical protein
MTCRAVTLPDGNACGAAATHRVTFSDGDSVETCKLCTLDLTELARSRGTQISTKPLEKKT